jgi:putative N6-adenine-specific DNA methylase
VSLHRYFATCARGLEPVLADELRALQARDVEPGRGGVGFAGGSLLLYRANLWLRTAVRVLLPILTAKVDSNDALYEAVRTIDWDQYLTPGHTLAVDCNVRDSAITHSMYAALRTKDAICDQMREKHGRRPSVDTETPMIGLNLHVYKNEAVLSLDSSGESLHKRGYRPVLTKAPINEALAAALVLMTGWRGEKPLIDPLCGSGTIPIEAAWLALDRAPGLTRRRFGFQGWMDFDVALWADLRDEARRRVRKTLPAPVLGYDLRNDSMSFSRANARAAGIGHLMTFAAADLKHFRPPAGPPGVLVCNPPYGERIGEEKELRPLYKMLGTVLTERAPGWGLFVFTGNARLAREIGLKPVSETPLFNGRIPCRFLEFRAG